MDTPAAPSVVTPQEKPTFEASIDEIRLIVRKRKGSWTLLSYKEWDDVAQEAITRAWQKWHLFNPAKGPLERWLNRLITRFLFNLRRDLLNRHARPCVGGWNAQGKMCVYNLGGDACGHTPSGRQCVECKVYADWKRAKEPLHHIKASVTIENHTQEVNNIQSDFMDIEGAKRIIDTKMRARLSPWERNVYRLVYIEHLTPVQASKQLKVMAAKRKRPLGPEDVVDYQSILGLCKQMKAIMIQIIQHEDL